MAKQLKDIYISWDWSGDEYALEGFNVAIVRAGQDPNTDTVIKATTGKEKTDIKNTGTPTYEHQFRDVPIDDDQTYDAYVQALFEGKDSVWQPTASSITIPDDGSATIAKADADGNPISANGGSVTLGVDGLVIESDNGDKAVLDSNLLAFYKSGYPDTPHWYSKRVAYGTAQDGDYIDLASETGVPWEKTPKVITSIKSLAGYTADYSANNQYYESFADSISEEGFYIYGKVNIPGAENSQEINFYLDISSGDDDVWVSPWSGSDCTQIAVKMEHSASGDSYYKIYYQSDDSGWIYYKTGKLSGGEIKTHVISSLNPNVWRMKLVSDYNTFAWVRTWYWYADTVVSDGEITWIAVEGGAD